MADNVTVGNDAGQPDDYVVATDDDGAAQHQYVKVEFGADNTQTKVTSSTGLPVNPVQETAGVGIGAAADAEAAANGSAIGILKRLRTLLGGGLPASLSGGRLDVAVGNTPAVTATDLDIRDLSEATDSVRVRGAAADGAAVVGNPVLVAGQDGTNVQSLKTDANGELQVDVLSAPTTTVQATDLDIRNLDKANDSVKAQIVDAAGDSAMDEANNAVRVNVVTGAGSGGTSSTDESAYTPATSVGTPLMGAADEASPDAAAEGTLAIARVTLNRALHVNLRDASGGEVSVGGGTQYDEDTASAAAEKLTMAGVVRNDSIESLVDTDGDRTVLQVDSAGRLYVNPGSTIVTATDLDIRNLSSAQDSVNAVTDGDATPGSAVPSTALYVAGTDGTNARGLKTDANGELQVDVLSLPAVTATDLDIRNLDVAQDDVRVGGMAAIDAAVADNPVLMGGRASTAQPSDVSADGDAQALWVDQKGSIVPVAAPHVGLLGEPWSLVHEAARYTTTQTSTVLIAGGASEKIVVTKVQIQVGGTTAGELQLYFGTGAFSRGTSRAIFDGEFAPSATLKPGVIMDGPFIAGTNGDDLMVTTSAAINPLTINVWYYVVT